MSFTPSAALAEQLEALAASLRPFSPKGLGLAIEVTAIVFGILATIIVVIRLLVRSGLAGPANSVWGVEDYLIVPAYIAFMASMVISVLAAVYGMGSYERDLPSVLYQMRAGMYLIYWQVNYLFASTLTKCAIGFACIRLDKRKRIRFPLYGTIMATVIAAIITQVFVLTNCRPLAVAWNPALPGECGKAITLQIVTYVTSTTQMLTDWMCAITPYFIVAKLQIPRRRKISIICILGLGIFASLATCIRIYFLQFYDTVKYPRDLMHNLGNIMLLSNIECGLGLIACSLPPLRKLFRAYYGSTRNKATSQNGKPGHYSTQSNSFSPFKGSHPPSSQNFPPSADWESLDDDELGRQGIVRVTEFSVTRAT